MTGITQLFASCLRVVIACCFVVILPSIFLCFLVLLAASYNKLLDVTQTGA